MFRKISIIAACLGGLTAPASAQVSGRTTPHGCIDLHSDSARLTVTGKVSLKTFAGPPNFESVASGDAAEQIFMIALPRPICLDDGGSFADPAKRFATVQVHVADKRLEKKLRAAIGKRVTLGGAGMPANTGHHHAPLVLSADRVSVR